MLFYYTVKEGDTLAHLANRFKTTVAAIVMFNEINPEEPLQPGTVLAIPLGFEG